VQFHYNKAPGIHFRVGPPAEYADSILRCLQHGLDRYFPSFPPTASIWINEVIVDEINSSRAAFYRAGLLVIHQVPVLAEIAGTDALSSDLSKA